MKVVQTFSGKVSGGRNCVDILGLHNSGKHKVDPLLFLSILIFATLKVIQTHVFHHINFYVFFPVRFAPRFSSAGWCVKGAGLGFDFGPASDYQSIAWGCV